MGMRTQNGLAVDTKTQNEKVSDIETHDDDEMGTRIQDKYVKGTWTPRWRM
ncbi:hypothetical protein SESBI_11216 [Sesbania bispinosa]|nr:hypothetical protein SESBI_11216 [Sesbania bispinosa]